MNVKLCVVFALACTLFRSAQGIIGADPVKVEDFNYNVIVTYKISDRSYYISGNIIHKRFVVTTAKYFVNVTWHEDKSSVKSVRLNNLHGMAVTVLPNVNSKPQKNEIIEKVTTLHLPQECLNSNEIHGSLAILELQNDLNLSRGSIQILKLPAMSIYNMKDYEKFAVFTGFGYNKAGIQDLRLMEVQIVDCPETLLKSSPIFCGGAIILHENINNSQNQSLGTWRGDNGGPLVWRKNTLIGFLYDVSDGDNRLGLVQPALFTNISYHLDFIKDVISGEPSLHITAPIPLS